MDITAEIKGINYQLELERTLREFSLKEFDINTCPSSCIVSDSNFIFGVSKWISPKRTRSYPYERVYNTLGIGKRITVIPIIKDEGKAGDRDFIQWDTVSLMSLLDVFVVFVYYNKAIKNPKKNNKITNQKTDNNYVLKKINEIKNYHSSALHWNLKEVNSTIPTLIQRVKKTYRRIEKELDVQMHSEKGIDLFADRFINGVNEFMTNSRKKAQLAQKREILITQPKESLQTISKATLTISNYLGGIYYLTTDEIKIQKDIVYLIESKHTKGSFLPSTGDIKDGLLKMILYSNLENIIINKKLFKHKPVLRLTSNKTNGSCNSDSNHNQIKSFINNNSFPNSKIILIEQLFKEAKKNGFIIEIAGSK